MKGTLRRAMDATSALLVVTAIALVLWPVSAPNADGNLPDAVELSLPAGAAMPSFPGSASSDSIITGIVRGNVFSASRRAPTTRFVPPGSESAPPMATMPGAYVTPAEGGSGGISNGVVSDSASGNTDGVPALYGIVSVDGARRALLSLRAGEAPRLFGVGERHAGYRVSAIENDRVVVQTARGSRTLRMTRPASRDSSEKSP